MRLPICSITFLANIGKDLACSIPNVDMSPLEYLKSPLCNTFFISPTTAEEIESKMTKLKTVMSKPLEVLFNASF